MLNENGCLKHSVSSIVINSGEEIVWHLPFQIHKCKIQIQLLFVKNIQNQFQGEILNLCVEPGLTEEAIYFPNGGSAHSLLSVCCRNSNIIDYNPSGCWHEIDLTGFAFVNFFLICKGEKIPVKDVQIEIKLSPLDNIF